MLIISNNCFGGYIYRDILHQKYNCPFIWSKIKEPYFEVLLDNFYKINFKNFEIKKVAKDMKKGFYLLIDNKVNVNYTHYIFDEKTNNPIKKGISVYYNKIWEYIVEKYETRIRRMNITDKICVAVEDYPQKLYNLNKIIEIINKNKWYGIIITKKKIQSTNNILILDHYTNINQPHLYKDIYKEKIFNFLIKIN